MSYSITHQLYAKLNDLYDEAAPESKIIEALNETLTHRPAWNINTHPKDEKHFIIWRHYSSQFYIDYLKKGGKLNFKVKHREKGTCEDVYKNYNLFAHLVVNGISEKNVEAFDYILKHHHHEINWWYGSQQSDYHHKIHHFIIKMLVEYSQMSALVLLKKIFQIKPHYFNGAPQSKSYHNLHNDQSSLLAYIFEDEQYCFNEIEVKQKKNNFKKNLDYDIGIITLMIEQGLDVTKNDSNFFSTKLLPQILNIDSAKTNCCQKILTSILTHQGIERASTFFNLMLCAPNGISVDRLPFNELRDIRALTIQNCFESLDLEQKKYIYLYSHQKIQNLGFYLYGPNSFFMDFERTEQLTYPYIPSDYDVSTQKTINLPRSVLCLLHDYPYFIDQLTKKNACLSNLSEENQSFLSCHISRFFNFIDQSYKKSKNKPDFLSLLELLNTLQSIEEKRNLCRLNLVTTMTSELKNNKI